MAAKSVVITGGTKGLGMAYATELLRRGHNVAICARSQSGVDAALAKLKRLAAG